MLGALVGFGACLALISVSYYYFSPSTSCHLNTFLTTSVVRYVGGKRDGGGLPVVEGAQELA